LWANRTLKYVKTFGNRLRRISRETDLFDPLATERYVLSQNWSNTYKNHILDAYEKFTKANQIEWSRTKRLREEEYPVKVPTEERINLIISSCTKTYALIYRISKYGLRPDEIGKITLRDLDLDRGELTVRTSKMGAGRTLKLKQDLVDLLREHIARRGIKNIDGRLFASSKKIKRKWLDFRQSAFEKFGDPELLKIRLYDLRHWFATTTYIKTRDIFYVKTVMGHRSIDNTLKYIHLANSLVNYSEDYTCKTAKTIDEATKLIESGFDYVTEMDGIKLFRKRK
jgi:integrase